MTIKSLVYFDKLHPEYLEIVNSINKIRALEIVHFICSLNTQLTIEGLTQFNGQLSNAIQQTKCDTIIIFTLTNDISEVLGKICSSSNHIYLILFPLNVSLSALEKLSRLPNITVNTCLPIRHLITIWRAHKKLISDSVYEPLQYIEAKFVTPILKRENQVFGSSLEFEINMNNFYQLIMIDAVQFLSQRMVMKMQAFSKSIASENYNNIKNEKYMHDYSVLFAHFKWKECDVKKSSTSTTNNSLLPARTALIRISCPTMDNEKMRFKIKIKSNAGLFVIDKHRLLVDGVDPESCDKLISDDSSESFWLSSLFCQGMERFVKHIEAIRQQGTPRLVDLGTQNEEDGAIAKISLIDLPQLIQLCKVVSAINKAVSSCQAVLVE